MRLPLAKVKRDLGECGEVTLCRSTGACPGYDVVDVGSRFVDGAGSRAHGVAAFFQRLSCNLCLHFHGLGV